MRVVVTGASGYLGRLVTERLVQAGFTGENMVGVDLLGSRLPPSRMRYVRRDVRDPRLSKDLERCDVLVHLAAIVEPPRNADVAYDVNVGGTRSVLRACEQAGVPNVVVASSVAAYGVQGDRVITEETPLLGDAESWYAHTKRLAEEEVDLFEQRNPQVRVARLRPPVIFGPRCDTWARDAMRQAARFDTPRGLRLPLLHEDDAAEAFYRAIVEPVAGTFLVAHRVPLTVADLATLARVRRVVLPERALLRSVDLAFRLGVTRTDRGFVLLAARNAYRFDPTRTERVLGWKPARAPEEALQAAVPPPRVPTTLATHV
jgi:UDP-glucose 4-epimerase